jgi:opacity protein-like surface antigen
MKITSFAVIIFILTSLTLDAQTIKPKRIYAKQKTFEIGGDIFLTSTQYTREERGMTTSDDNSTLAFVINASAGLFVIDGLKLAVEPAIGIISYNNSTSTNLKLYFTPEYVFDMKNEVYPYIGGSIGYTSSSYSNSSSSSPTQSGFSWGGKGGIKINAFGNALINVGISYYRETYNYTASFGDVKQHYNILGVKAGLSVFFR